MKTSLLSAAGLTACLCALYSCDSAFEPLGIERSWFEARNGVRVPNPAPKDPQDQSVTTCLVSYPEDYDWRRDTLCGDLECRLLVYRDSTLLRAFPAGWRHQTSPEADTHFLFGEDLFTIWRDRGKVVIKKNGLTLTEFASTEIIRGILPLDGALWTLGTDASGLHLRKDGETVFERKGAEVYDAVGDNGTDISGALYTDRSRICFSYTKDGQWHIVSGTEDTIIDAGGAIDMIMRVRLLDGTLYILGDRQGAPGPYLYDGKSNRKLLYYTLDPQSDQRLFVQDGEVFFAGCIWDKSGMVTTEVWDADNRQIAVRSGLCHIYSAKDGGAYVALACTGAAYTPEVGECVYVNSPGCGAACFDTGHYFSGSRGAAYSDGVLAVGLAPLEGRPFVWKNGERIDFPVHGYVSAVSFPCQK